MVGSDVALSKFQGQVLTLLRAGLRLGLYRPQYALRFGRLYRNQRQAAQRRRDWETRGLQVPPLLIATVTGRCNLHCAGCYAWAQGRPSAREMPGPMLLRTIAQAHDLGIAIFMLAGGEPLTRPDLLDVTATYPDIWFPMFTNGTLLDDTTVARLARQPHVLPLISLEGDRQATDARRGAGVYDQVLAAMAKLRRAGVFFGTSVTLTRPNLPLVTGPAFIEPLIQAGCRAFTYVNYIPVEPGTEQLVPSPEQLAGERQLMADLRRRHRALFARFPGDEEATGGCLAAGRGLFHISPEGHLEPCPFSPFSDVRLQDMSLQEALRSLQLFCTIRENVCHLPGQAGRCLLFDNREWLAGVAARCAPAPISEPQEALV
jgi:MoaA/NifB/PqqE/SkfB family radical SAM enzyme